VAIPGTPGGTNPVALLETDGRLKGLKRKGAVAAPAEDADTIVPSGITVPSEDKLKGRTAKGTAEVVALIVRDCASAIVKGGAVLVNENEGVSFAADVGFKELRKSVDSFLDPLRPALSLPLILAVATNAATTKHATIILKGIERVMVLER
jgi:hypothetical protein